MRAADLQTVLSNTAMVQQIHQQAEHRADNVQHQFVLESHVVRNQKQQAVVKPEEGQAAEIHRERDRKNRNKKDGASSSPEEETPQEELDLSDPNCGHILDLQA
jgi:hypothetical protein